MVTETTTYACDHCGEEFDFYTDADSHEERCPDNPMAADEEAEDE